LTVVSDHDNATKVPLMSTATNPLPYGGGLSLSKRELFAAAALQGIMVGSNPDGRTPDDRTELDDVTGYLVPLVELRRPVHNLTSAL
jgi:hypothetical protein